MKGECNYSDDEIILQEVKPFEEFERNEYI